MENRVWKEYKISDIAKLEQGLALNKKTNHLIKSEGLPLFRIKDLLEGKEEIYIDEINVPSKCLVYPDDLIMTRTGQVGYVFLGKRGVLHNNSFKIILDEEKCYTPFLYWYFNSSKKRDFLTNISAGSVQPDLTHKIFNEIEIQLPPLPEQKAIASVLSSLDDKIDLLHQQNQTLEALAETLFRQWFIEEAKEDWDVLPLSEIAEVKNGKSFKSSDFTDNDFNSFEVVKMGHIERGGGLKLNPKKDYVSREMDVEKWVLNKGDIIMAMTDMKDNVVILGVPAMIDKDDHYVLNQRVARIYLKDNSKLISNYLLYIQLNNKEFIAELQTKANSGVQVNLSTGAIKESEILIPPISLQKEFGQKIIDFYSKIENNREQIQTLTKLRNTLLPKLMSGEVKVKN